MNSINTKSNLGDVTYLCSKQKTAIDAVIKKLEANVLEFKPRSPDSSIFIRYINRLISYFKKDFLTVENTESLIKEKISSLKIINKSLDYKSKFLEITEENVVSGNKKNIFEHK